MRKVLKLAAAMVLCLWALASAGASERLDIVPEPYWVIFTDGDAMEFDSVSLVGSELWDSRLEAAAADAFGLEAGRVDSEDAAGGGLAISLFDLDELPEALCAEAGCDMAILRGEYVPDDGPEMDNESYLLEVAVTGSGPAARIYSATPNGRFYAIKTLKAVVKKREALRLEPMLVFDYPQISIRGILEGYYGKPWTESETIRMIEFSGDFKMNIFIYAPKDDPKNRALWRQPYTEREKQQFVLYAERSEENFIHFCWQLSPGQSIQYSSERDYQALLAKFKSIIELGIDCFNLAFDDVDPVLRGEDAERFETYAEAQVFITNKLRGDVRRLRPDARFSFVPQQYSNAQIEGDYLERLGKGLYPDVIVGWTGNDICALEIVPEDADEFAALIKRKPLLGDNFPVVDTYLTRTTLHMGYLVNRSPDLGPHIMGFVANAMPWALSSRVALGTIADYSWNPTGYQPISSWENTVFQLVGGEAFEPFMDFAIENQASLIWFQDNPATVELVEDFWAAYEAGDLAAVRDRWTERFTTLAEIDDRIKTTLDDEEFWREIVFWVGKLAASAETALAALDALQAKLDGALTDEELQQFRAVKSKMDARQGVVVKHTFPDFFARVASELGL